MTQHSDSRLVALRFVLRAALGAGLAWALAVGWRTMGVASVIGQELPALAPGQVVQGELAPGQKLSYAVQLEAGTFVLFEMIVHKADSQRTPLDTGAQLTLYGPQGELFYQEWHSARKVEAGWRQTMRRVIATSGTYRLEASARAAQTTPAPYQLRIAELRSATEEDRVLEAAEVWHLKAGRMFDERQAFDEAIAVGEKALAVYQRLLPADSGDTGNLAIVLTNLYSIRGYHRDMERRAELLEITARNRAALLGPDHIEIAIIYTWLAEQVDPVRAEKFYQKTMEILVRNVGAEHPFVGVTLTNLGETAEALGDKARAAGLYERAIRMIEKTSGPEDPALSGVLIKFGQIQLEKKDWATAEACFQRVLAILIRHPEGAHTESDPKSGALSSLAELHQRQGDFAQADAYQQKLLEHHKATNKLPHQHPWASAYQQMGNFAIARGEYEAAARHFEQARQVLEQTGNSPMFASLLRDWSKLHQLTGRIDEAVGAQRRAVAMSEAELNRLLVYGSEREKLKLLSLFAVETAETLSLHARSAPRSPAALELAFTTWLQRKGRVLDEMNRTIGALRLAAVPGAAELIEQWIDKTSLLSLLSSRTAEDKDPASQLARIAQLNEEIEQLQATISQRSAVFRAQTLPVTLESVRAALPEDSALVEFAQYQPEDARTKQKAAPRYLAYVLPKKGALRWVELGEVAKVDAAVQILRTVLGDELKRTDPRPAARALDRLVMQPVRPLLGRAHTVFLSPEGALNLVPFAALRDTRGRYLVEDYLFVYLTSGRDLLRLRIKHQSQAEELILAVSDFDEQAAAAPASVVPASGFSDLRGNRLSDSPTMATLRFERLRFALAEGKAVQRVEPRAQFYPDAQATETLLKQVRRPRFLHIVTHGFFLPDSNAKLENPLLRSGIALAGANQRRSGRDDGLLTAFEAAALDLWGTKLVVLSGCETGAGEVQAGEGVYGLRRALVLAGAETQLMSLWNVSDRAGRRLMENYYLKLKAGVGRAAALRQVQLQMLRREGQQHPFFWASFVAIGEWTSLDGRR